LSEIGHKIGLLQNLKYDLFSKKRQMVLSEIDRLARTRIGSTTIAQHLSRPEVTYATLPNRDASLPAEVAHQVETEIKYSGYIERQTADIIRMSALEGKGIPDDFDFSTVPSLSVEARQKLARIKPQTVGQAVRISGVTPADISILVVWLGRYKNSMAGGSDALLRIGHGRSYLDKEIVLPVAEGIYHMESAFLRDRVPKVIDAGDVNQQVTVEGRIIF